MGIKNETRKRTRSNNYREGERITRERAPLLLHALLRTLPAAASKSREWGEWEGRTKERKRERKKKREREEKN